MTRTPYRYRGPQTWAAAREAYLAGETAASVGARLGLTAGAIHQRSRREGWQRKALGVLSEADALQPAPPADAPAAAAPEAPAPAGPPPTAGEALDLALAAAAGHLRSGRTEAAATVLRLGETLVRLVEAAQRQRAYTLEDALCASAQLRERVEAAADRAARGALTSPQGLEPPLCEWAYRWRAEHLGPECAAADAARRAAFAQ